MTLVFHVSFSLMVRKRCVAILTTQQKDIIVWNATKRKKMMWTKLIFFPRSTSQHRVDATLRQVPLLLSKEPCVIYSRSDFISEMNVWIGSIKLVLTELEE
jgi:hypothetical protein